MNKQRRRADRSRSKTVIQKPRSTAPIGDALRKAYRNILDEPVPDRLKAVIAKIRAEEEDQSKD